MSSMKVSPSTIEQILAHKDPLRSERVGGSASHYISFSKVMDNFRDPQEEALSKLADALNLITQTEVVSAPPAADSVMVG